MASVAIIIPNWNNKNFLSDCLESLKKTNYRDFNIIVVDNGSNDGTVDLIRNKYQEVILLENKINLGFAAACNRGVKKAIRLGSDFFLLLNNDTIVTPDFLGKMIQVFNDQHVGIVGCKINYYDDKGKIWFAGGDFIKWRASGKHRYWMKHDNNKLTGIKDSDFITGCCMLIRKAVINDIGYFYEPYFLGVEDLDFCYFAKKSGWKIKVNLDTVIYHKVSLSREGEFSFSNGYYGTRNRLFFAFKRSKNYLAGLVLLFVIAPIRIIQWSVQGRMQMLRGLLFGIRDFLKNKQGEHLT